MGNNAEVQVLQKKEINNFDLTPVGQNLRQFEITQRQAKMYASSTIVPDNYKDSIGNCAIALDMSMRMNASPLMVMQNLVIIHGNPTFSSKFLIASVNASGKFTPLRYQFEGKEGDVNYGCRAYAYEVGDKEHKEPLYGELVTMKMATAEGWVQKNGSKWKTMPTQMMRYRAASFWQKVYCPEITMGFPTTEEIEDATIISDDSNMDSVNVKTETAEIVDPDTGEVLTPKEEPKKAIPKEKKETPKKVQEDPNGAGKKHEDDEDF